MLKQMTVHPKSVDGSYLISADSSTGYTPKNNERGEHHDGWSVFNLQKREQNESMPMDQQLLIIQLMLLAVIVYVDQYNETDGKVASD